MESSWSHDDVFPAIARAIESLSAQQRGFARHDDIVARLLSDPEAVACIDSARTADAAGHSREWTAHNMVAWFSQRITVGESDWTSRFDRQKIDGKWSYRVAT